MTRTAAVAALAALAALAAIIAADFTAPAAAQSEDETTGRIVARRLDDGRVEFGWQPAGAARVLPTKRYFPASIDHDRWLRSSPVEVAGSAIGRINARLLSDGRIEFAFTPTDGERIAPQARYFPADARAGRWLRSTEIAIGPARTGYIAVSAGSGHTCAIRTSGEITCWGDNRSGETDAPEGRFTAISTGWNHICAIRESGEIECWGYDEYGETDAPAGSFTAVSTGWSHTCAIRESGDITCWGVKGFLIKNPNTGERGVIENGQTNAPDGTYTAISTGAWHSCAIHAGSGTLECWGLNPHGQWTRPPQGNHTAVGASRTSDCAIHESGELTCWGWDQHSVGKLNAPEGSYTAIDGGREHFCAIRDTGGIECWGDNDNGGTDAPEGRFTAVSAGSGHTCAIRESGEIECWGGRNRFGQATPPTD